MADQIALKQCLYICGFTTQNDLNKIVINEGIISLQYIGLLTNKEIFAMAHDTEGRQTEANRIVFGVTRLKKLCALGFWFRDRNFLNLVLNANVFTFMALQTAICAMDSEKDLNKSTSKDDIKILKFSGGVDFPRWVEDVRNALGACIGVSGIILDYITRAIMDPDAFINDTERFRFGAAHVGYHFQRDNVEVSKLLQYTTDRKNNLSGWPHTKRFERTKDGRETWIALT